MGKCKLEIWGSDGKDMELPLDTNLRFCYSRTAMTLHGDFTTIKFTTCSWRCHICTIVFVQSETHLTTLPYDTSSSIIPCSLVSSSHLPLLPSTFVLLSTHHRRRSTTLLLPTLRRTQRRLLPEIQPDHILHAPSIMLNSTHIRQSRSSRPLRRALHNLNALHKRTVDLIPHLHAHACQLATEQDCGVDSATPDVDAYAGEGVASALADEQDVADTRAFGVVFCEEAGAGVGGVEEGGLGGCYGCDGVGAGLLNVGCAWGEDGDAEVFA
jgi:hypothetical protein